VADCAINVGFDAIKYPSVRRGERHNIVILDGIAGWEYINIDKITKMYPSLKGELEELNL
jgi:hypothetical protein